ncbi:Deoxyribonuclease-1 [Amphibalanus amphitrite]|uniref:Deoxyribonuclease-1 n=1 Tax=Amphibalanus amphitrite TaxID=1232801 RepID=A0A6A4WXD3_AMPAM|nr:Deoxyribonuclease-1 [Amphibalanus amphitrite]
MLRDRVVMGVRDSRTQQALLKKSGLSLTQAIDIALAEEAASRDSKLISAGDEQRPPTESGRLEAIRAATEADPVLTTVIRQLQLGWPDDRRRLPASLRAFHHLPVALVLALLAGAQAEVATVVSSPLSIAAFNVQRFGLTKMDKPEVMELLTRILSQYDITLVQEIVDISETAIHNLTERVAEHTGLPYRVSLSPRVGRNSYEQYGYVYRSDRVRVVSEQMYPDATDVFAREPYIVTFDVDDVRHLSRLTLVGIHTQPSKAPEEIDALSDVLDYVESQLGAQNVVLLGDFNAGCSYVTGAEWAVNRLKGRGDVTWAIADYTDTTVHATNCAYDRIVMKGTELSSAVVEGSFGPFRFDEEWGIAEELTEDTSDHYPVHMKLKPKTLSAAERYLYPLEVFAVTDKRGVSFGEVEILATSIDTASYNVLPLYDSQGALQKIAAGGYSDPTVYEAASSPRWFCRITCSVETSGSCMVAVEKRTLIA